MKIMIKKCFCQMDNESVLERLLLKVLFDRYVTVRELEKSLQMLKVC